MGKANPKLDFYFKQAAKWPEEMKRLRSLLLESPLTEELKWGKPCYTHQQGNVVLIVEFKNYCALLFCKGALLKNTGGLLVRPGENTRAARQIRFTHVREILEREKSLKRIIKEAIAVEKAGLEVDYRENRKLNFPEEFQNKLEANPALKSAFAALTPGRQRAYNLYFSAARQSKTREARVEKCLGQILQGKGINDR